MLTGARLSSGQNAHRVGDRQLALALQVMREVDGGHAAGAEFALDAVPRAKRGVETLECC